MLEDFAHVLHCEWWSFKDLQCTALAERLEKQPGAISHSQTSELLSFVKNYMHEEYSALTAVRRSNKYLLASILKEVQQVLKLLLFIPKQELDDFHVGIS